jgi:predicted MFS family arabinose efflux permease
MSADKYLRLEILVTFFFNILGLMINRPVFWMLSRFLSSAIGGGSFTARTLLCCEEYPEYSSSAIAVVSLTSGIASIIATPLLNMLAEATTFRFAMYFSLVLSIGAWAMLKFGYRSHGASRITRV